jgi:hypothetical protein
LRQLLGSSFPDLFSLATAQVVMSTKNVLGRPWVEFVLGIDQVIKGFDRALPMMSVGERSMITVTPEYGCKLVYLLFDVDFLLLVKS